MGTCAVEDELVKSACAHLYYSWHRFRDQVLGPGDNEGSCVGGETCPGGKYEGFRSVLNLSSAY